MYIVWIGTLRLLHTSLSFGLGSNCTLSGLRPFNELLGMFFNQCAYFHFKSVIINLT